MERDGLYLVMSKRFSFIREIYKDNDIIINKYISKGEIKFENRR
jgi:hypothetical protein